MACFQFSSFLYFRSFLPTSPPPPTPPPQQFLFYHCFFLDFYPPNLVFIIVFFFFLTFIPQTWFHIVCWSVTGTVWLAVSFKFNETVDFTAWSFDIICVLASWEWFALLSRSFSEICEVLISWVGESWEWFALLSFRFSEIVEFFFRSVNLMSWTGVSWEWFALLSFRFNETVEFFYVKPKPGENEVTPEYFFSLWHTFCQDFKDHWKREQQRIIKLRSAYSIVFSFSSGQHTA